MIYFIIFFIVLILIFLVMVWIRKTLWDAVHRNLLEFEDHHEGRVQRRNIFTPPLFSGKIDDIVTAINFSSAREKDKRINYINLSLDIDLPFSFSLTRKDWLATQNVEAAEDFMIIKNSDGVEFLLRPASKENVKNLANDKLLLELIDICSDMSYLYFGPTGVLFELVSTELLRDTEYDTLITKIKQIIKLGKKVNGYKNS